MDSSSSSEDEKLKEAVSSELVQCMTKKKENKKNGAKLPKSVREAIKNEKLREESCKYEVNTTKELQKHVGIKLERYLDSIIDIYSTKKISNEKQKSYVCGIKLLNDSMHVLTGEDSSSSSQTKPPVP